MHGARIDASKKSFDYGNIVDDVEILAQELSGFNPYIYHGNLSERDKRINVENFSISSTRVICATTALGMGMGMGMDFQNLTLVIFYGAPWSMMDYVQQSGRIGRLGEPSRSLIYISSEYLNTSKIQNEEDQTLTEFLWARKHQRWNTNELLQNCMDWQGDFRIRFRYSVMLCNSKERGCYAAQIFEA